MMALQKQLVSIDLTGGLSKKEDSQLRLPTSLDVCENLAFDDAGVLSPRDGLSIVTSDVAIGAAMSTPPKSLAVLSGNQLVLEDAQSTLFTVHESGVSGSVNQGAVAPRLAASVRTDVHAVAPGGTVIALDSATISGITVTVWDDGSSAWYIAQSAATGALLADKTLVTGAGGGGNPRVVARSSSEFTVWYVTGGQLYRRTITVAAPQTLGAATAVGGATLTSGRFDAITNRAGVTAIGVIDAGVATFWLYDGSWALLYTVTAGSGADHESPAVAYFGNGKWLVAWWDASLTTIRFETLSSVWASLNVTTVTGVVSSPDVLVMGGSPEVSDTVDVLWTESVANGIYHKRIFDSTSGATALGAMTVAYPPNCTVASRPWTANGQVQVLIRRQANQINPPCTLFVGNEDGGRITARVLFSTSRGAETPWRVPEPYVTTSSNVTTSATAAAVKAGYLVIQDEVDKSPSLVQTVTLDYARTVRPPAAPVTVDGLLVYPGANPTVFDGQYVAELGFHEYPRMYSYALAGAGSVANGAYQYTALFEWTDARGTVHRSAPAIPMAVTVTGGPRAVTINVSTLFRTRKQGDSVNIVIYRTLASGTTFYRVGSVANDVAVETVAFSDTLADASIDGNQLLPITGGVLEPESPPACRLLCLHQRRLFAAGLEDPFEIRYTHEMLDPSIAPEFNSFLRLRIPSTHGEITGLASLDDRLVVLTERGGFVFTGSGPDATGGNNGYSDAQLILSGCGCPLTAPNSVQVTSLGLWFQSDAGLRCLGRDLQLVAGRHGPLGSEVDALLSGYTCVGVVDYPAKNQVRFYYSAGVLVFDRTFGQWSRFIGAMYGSTYLPCAAVAQNGVPVHAVDAGYTYRAGGTTDNGSEFSTRWRTGWLRLAAVQGYQRVWRVLGLARVTKTAGGTFQVTLEKDYATDADAEISGASLLVTTYTGGATAVGSVFQFRHHVKNQKVQAIQIEVSTNRGELAWTNLTLEVGVKHGAAKLASTRELT